LTWPDDSEAFKEDKTAMPGDNVEMVVSMMHPLAVDIQQRFNIREGGRTVATGLITRIIE